MNKKERVISILTSLVRINSENPPGNEEKVARYLRAFLRSGGFSCKILEFKKHRSNLIAAFPSKTHRKKILLTPHLDTVPAGDKWTVNPFSGFVQRGRVYGRGATDCKVNVAVAAEALMQLREEKGKLENLDVILAASADEETGNALGIIPLLPRLGKIDYGVVLDCDEFEVVYGQKALLHIELEVAGKKAHGAYPERGRNAIEEMLKILSEIKELEKLYREKDPTKAMTVNFGRIQGGEKVNIVADACKAEIDIRFFSQRKKDVIRRVRDIVRRNAISCRFSVLAYQPSIQLEKGNILMRTFQRVLRAHQIGFKPLISKGATVITYLAQRGICGCAFGFGSRATAHASDEYVAVKNVFLGVRVLKDFLCELDHTIGENG